MKRSLPLLFSLSWILIIAGCPQDDTVDPGADPDAGGSDVSADTQAPDTSEDDISTADEVTCEPQCTEGVCTDDGCGDPCPACATLPAPVGTACQISGSPDAPTDMTVVDAFPNLAFQRPIAVTYIPDGTDRLAVVEKRGVIKMFANDPAVTHNDLGLLLDIQGKVDSSDDEGGLLGIAFHPDFTNTHFVYVNYTGKVNNQLTTFVSRFTVGVNGEIDPATELALLTISQPFGNHNGGALAFGPDGYLYIGVGDGGSGGDPYNHGQNTETLLGSILRIDVDNPDGELNYGIPADNPFAVDGNVAGRAEIWAWGLRNPWRFSFDPLTGQLWVGDVGQELYEEVLLVEGGKNYGWNIMEGEHCFKPKNDCPTDGLELPVIEYDHTIGKSITGGYVYRGEAFPELFGAYLYADYVTGIVFAARFADDATPEVTTIYDGFENFASFGLDQHGEVLLVDYPFFEPDNGKLFRLERNTETPPAGTFPLTLSATGCFTDLETLSPAEGVLTYSVNSPLWHDGADSVRHLVMPSGGTLTPRTTGAWTLPDGGKLIKTFVYDGPGGERIKVETRFLLREGDTYRYYSYRWNAEQTDAVLLSGAAVAEVPVGDSTIEWHFPSRSQCRTCHNPAAGHLLGWHTGQLNRRHVGDDWAGDQLFSFGQLGILGAEVDLAELETVAWPEPGDSEAPVASRARAALHSNCASCHVPDGPTTTPLDLRYETALPDMAVCEVQPEKGDAGNPSALILDPGAPANSTLVLRMQSTGDDRMPNIGSQIVDEVTVDLVSEWVSGLQSCD